MSKKIITLAALALAALALTGCGKEAPEKSQIVDKKGNTSATATFLPTATAAPDAAEKAAQKAASGDANVTVTDSDGTTRQVDLEFQIINQTGIDFVQMFIEPVTTDISQIAKGTKRFEDGFVFKNNTTINLKPPTGYTLDTTLFNMAAIDANGTGYVFQNLDLASSSVIALLFEDGVPKAVINPELSEE